MTALVAAAAVLSVAAELTLAVIVGPLVIELGRDGVRAGRWALARFDARADREVAARVAHYREQHRRG